MKLYQRVWDWYKRLPWWGKVLGVVVLLLVALLAVLSVVNRVASPPMEILEEIDEQHREQVDSELKTLEDDAEITKREIQKKKIEVFQQINQARKIDAKTIEVRKEIQAAKTMDELDELQRKLGL